MKPKDTSIIPPESNLLLEIFNFKKLFKLKPKQKLTNIDELLEKTLAAKGKDGALTYGEEWRIREKLGIYWSAKSSKITRHLSNDVVVLCNINAMPDYLDYAHNVFSQLLKDMKSSPQRRIDEQGEEATIQFIIDEITMSKNGYWVFFSLLSIVDKVIRNNWYALDHTAETLSFVPFTKEHRGLIVPCSLIKELIGVPPNDPRYDIFIYKVILNLYSLRFIDASKKNIVEHSLLIQNVIARWEDKTTELYDAIRADEIPNRFSTRVLDHLRDGDLTFILDINPHFTKNVELYYDKALDREKKKTLLSKEGGYTIYFDRFLEVSYDWLKEWPYSAVMLGHRCQQWRSQGYLYGKNRQTGEVKEPTIGYIMDDIQLFGKTKAERKSLFISFLELNDIFIEETAPAIDELKVIPPAKFEKVRICAKLRNNPNEKLATHISNRYVELTTINNYRDLLRQNQFGGKHLLALRELMRKSQLEMSIMMGYKDDTQYGEIERGNKPLTTTCKRRIFNLLGHLSGEKSESKANEKST